MDYFLPIYRFIEYHQLIKTGDTLIIGFSGGPDSVMLTHLLQSMQTSHKLTLILAHLDHGWPADSYKDAEFCAQYAQKHNLILHTAHASELQLDKKYNGSLEEQGRLLRRLFFTQLAERYNAQAIALGHTQDDQRETFLMRLIRGAALTGLTGMQPREGLFIRPLLEASKKDILGYLKKNNIDYCSDSSNSDQRFLRTRIRQILMPALQATDNRAPESISHTMSMLQETEDYLEKHTRETFSTCLIPDQQQLTLNRTAVCALDPFMQKRVLMHFFCEHKGLAFTPSAAFLDEALRFIHNPSSGTHALHTDWRLVKEKNKLYIIKL